MFLITIAADKGNAVRQYTYACNFTSAGGKKNTRPADLAVLQEKEMITTLKKQCQLKARTLTNNCITCTSD